MREAADKAPGVPGHNYNDCTDSRAALALSKPAPCGFFVFLASNLQYAPIGRIIPA